MNKPWIERFREAVAAGEFARAEHLWNGYAAGRLEEARRGCGDRLPEMRELIEWTRRTALCWRAQALHKLKARLTAAYAAGVYRGSPR
jgi:hypothetical protein